MLWFYQEKDDGGTNADSSDEAIFRTWVPERERQPTFIGTILTILADINCVSLPEGKHPSSHLGRDFAPGKGMVLFSYS